MSTGSLKSRAVKAASVASLALFATAGLAVAAQAAPAGATGCSSAGGGTWCQGTSMGDWGLKKCYSNYVHPYNYHSSTASMASQIDKRYASAGSWSNASVTAGWAYTCYTYYNPNA